MSRVYRAAVIGRTGRGDYGHGLDLALLGHPNVRVVAVADEDEEGGRRAAARIGAPAVYRSYDDMLERERPELVVVAPRQPDCHREMVVAAAESVAHVFCEKPLATSLVESDDMLTACSWAGVKLAVAHQARVLPAARRVRELIGEGAIGRLRAIRGYGKCDQRGGAQDLMVLGTHVLDLMIFFAGNPRWCDARLTRGGRTVGPEDVRPGDETIGPIAGDGVHATYGFENGIVGTYESFVDDHGGGSDFFGLDLHGTGGIISMRGGLDKDVYRYPRPIVIPGSPHRWERIPTDTPAIDPSELRLIPPGTNQVFWATNRAILADLLRAAEEQREPICSGAAAAFALEMILAAHESHRLGARVPFPLPRRQHPWSGS